MSDPADEHRSAIKNVLKEQDGRAFMAVILRPLGFFTSEAHESAYSLVHLLDQVDHKGVMDMIQENFLRGGSK